MLKYREKGYITLPIYHIKQIHIIFQVKYLYLVLG